MIRALVSGGAGFIGSHLVDRLLAEGCCVTAIDNFDSFYDPDRKRANITSHLVHPDYTLIEGDILDGALLESLQGEFDVVVHLAAKAGVRPSIVDPAGYQRTNVLGTQNLLDFARQRGIRQFIFASSSSVYGVNPQVPWREDDSVLLPISPYAATKVAAELLGHVYSHLYGIRFVALRLFTVFGPRQRPDLAIHKFACLLLNGERLPIYGDGSAARDYTFVSDIVSGIRSAMEYDQAPYAIFNIGAGRTITVLDMIRSLGETLDLLPVLEYLDPKPGDVPQTLADISAAKRHLGYEPQVDFQEGIRQFTRWLRSSGQPVSS